MKIKICGITEIETLNFLIENGVDYVGFIFHENSPRNVTHAFINEIKNIDFQKSAVRKILFINVAQNRHTYTK